VYKVLFQILKDETTCVDKMHKVYNNKTICSQKFKEMYKEFRIGC